MTLAVYWLMLVGAAVAILLLSRFLVSSADVIAARTGIGRSFAGVLMLATATSLPELVTGVSSIRLVDQPDLAAGDAFGSNLVNLVIIGISDLLWRNGPILAAVGRGPILVGLFGIGCIAVTIAAMFVHNAFEFAAGWAISPLSLLLFGVFLIGMFMIYRQGAPTENPDASEFEMTLPRASLIYTVTMLGIVVAAIVLAFMGERLAHEMGWETSFVGTQFLAISTSLPEFAASYAAIRIAAPELAISNLLGSNLFNMGFVLVIDDAVYTQGPLWSGIAEIHQLTAAFAVLMTIIAIAAIRRTGRQDRQGRFTLEGVSLIGLYVAVSALVFALA